MAGYASVFALRTPDFSHGLARRRDLGWCVGLLGGQHRPRRAGRVLLYRATGRTDVVAALAGSTLGDLLIAVAVIAATSSRPRHSSG